jgi:hypothetical protein
MVWVILSRAIWAGCALVLEINLIGALTDRPPIVFIDGPTGLVVAGLIAVHGLVVGLLFASWWNQQLIRNGWMMSGYDEASGRLSDRNCIGAFWTGGVLVALLPIGGFWPDDFRLRSAISAGAIMLSVVLMVSWRAKGPLSGRQEGIKATLLRMDQRFRAIGRVSNMASTAIGVVLMMGILGYIAYHYFLPVILLALHYSVEWNMQAMTIFICLVLFTGALTAASLIWLCIVVSWNFVVRLIGKKPLEDEMAHGPARAAKLTEAKDAARGTGAKPAWADHGYAD